MTFKVIDREDGKVKVVQSDVVKENGVIIGYHGYVPCAGGGGGDLYWTPMG